MPSKSAVARGWKTIAASPYDVRPMPDVIVS
jgi:hypothetical protein